MSARPTKITRCRCLLLSAWCLASCGVGAHAQVEDVRPADTRFDLDLDGDACPDVLRVFTNKQTELGLMHAELCSDGEAREVSTAIMPMWFAQPAWLAGESGAPFVVVGTLSNQRRHDEPDPHRTVHVWSIQDGRWSAVWRGSALARPLIDVAIVRRDGVDLLVANERSGDRVVVTTYAWNGFGFIAAAPSD